MTPEQIADTAIAVEDMKTISVAAPEPYDAQNLQDLFVANDLVHAMTTLSDLTATGFSYTGMAAIERLARSLRTEGADRSRDASAATLTRVIAAEIIHRLKGRIAASLTDADYDSITVAVDDWFRAQSRTRLHAVPCTIAPYPAPAIVVGPVTFHHVQDFPHALFGVERKDFWPTTTAGVPNPKIGGFYFERLIDLANERRAPWIAVVTIPGRAINESIATADVVTDIALASLQLAAPGLDLRGISRATSRAAPVWRTDVWKDGSIPQEKISNREPARAVTPDLFAHATATVVPALALMGRRMSVYLEATSVVPNLDEAWCNAAYWYHQALAETLDTVAVAKLETSIEVLFRSESMDGSKRRIVGSFDAIFGLSEQDTIPGSAVTVREFTLAITTARSRVLHGTWPTIHTDLPGYKKQRPVTFGDVESLASKLLLALAEQIEAYVDEGQTVDTTDGLLDWIKGRRLAATSPVAPVAP